MGISLSTQSYFLILLISVPSVCFPNQIYGRIPVLTPIILDTQEAEVRKIKV
jgi:hypothetical protein